MYNPRGMFQSRNRESYLFKSRAATVETSPAICFNLVIENLIFSSEDLEEITDELKDCFNLVIENLIFSRLKTVFEELGGIWVSIS